MRDQDVRRAVRDWLRCTHSLDIDTLIVEEMGVWSGSVRIDVAVINGELSGFELKSDQDTLLRLDKQADIYSRVFDRVSLVVGSRHASKALGKIPSWWGVVVANMKDGIVELDHRRAATLNPSPDPYLVAQLLWKEEALEVLKHFNLDKGWRAKRIKSIHQRLAHEISFDELRFHVRTTLKSRSSWLIQGSCPRAT